MSDKSPLFVSSLELIAHATELFALNNSKKYKFIILHLTNAVELILKDHVIDRGISIYVAKTNNTIGIWECISQLESQGINIPEIPVLQLLIDDRNNIQHRFGHPTAEAVYYYIEQVIGFFQRILKEYYNIELSEALRPHLTEEHIKLLGLTKNEPDYISTIDKLADISIEASILKAYAHIEKDLAEYLSPYPSYSQAGGLSELIWTNRYLRPLLRDFELKGYVTGNMYHSLIFLRQMRNAVAHKPEMDPENSDDLRRAFSIAKELLAGLQKAKEAGYQFVPHQESEAHSDTLNIE